MREHRANYALYARHATCFFDYLVSMCGEYPSLRPAWTSEDMRGRNELRRYEPMQVQIGVMNYVYGNHIRDTLYSLTMPRSTAQAAIWARDVKFRVVRMAVTCPSAVRGLMLNRSAIWAFE